MPIFRKIPMELEAYQFTGGYESAFEIGNWIRENGGTGTWFQEYAWVSDALKDHPPQPEYFHIKTDEVELYVRVGEWVIKGPRGGFYIEKPEVFITNFQLVDGDELV